MTPKSVSAFADLNRLDAEPRPPPCCRARSSIENGARFLMAGSPRRKSQSDAVHEQDGLPSHAYATGVPHRSARQHGAKPASSNAVEQRAEGLIVVKKEPKTAPVRLNLNTDVSFRSMPARCGGPPFL
jgi:hypothetical protein